MRRLRGPRRLAAAPLDAQRVAEFVDESFDGELSVAQLAALVLGDRTDNGTETGESRALSAPSLRAVEAATSNVASTLVDDFWACCPPGPLDREKRSSISAIGTSTERVTRIVSTAHDPSVSRETRCAVVDGVRTVAAMRVAVDADKCQGHNRCYAIAPELFDVDDYGQSVVIGDGTVPLSSPTRPASPSPTARSTPSASSRRTAVTSTSYGPVTDWATDLDHADPAYNRDAPEIWRSVREAGCPVAHSDRYHGMWVPLTHEYVAEVAYDTEHFTSRGVVVSRGMMDDFPEGPIGGAPPITSDPPFHHHARRILLPPFAPKAIERWEPEVRALCAEPRRRRSPRRRRRRSTPPREYAQHIPVDVIARMLGLPLDDDELFRQFVHDALEAVDVPTDERIAYSDELDAYLDERIAEHEAEPADDLISYLLGVELFGERLSRAHVRGCVVLLLLAGIDTTWSAIGSSLWHLATHPDDRRRLVAEPELIPTAVEELLRAYAPVTMARFVAKDHDFHGHPMKARRLGAAAVPGGEPRPGGVRPARRRRHRPAREPPRRLRPRHPPLPRLQPRPPRAARRHRGVPRPRSPSSSSPTRPATASCGVSVRCAGPRPTAAHPLMPRSLNVAMTGRGGAASVVDDLVGLAVDALLAPSSRGCPPSAAARPAPWRCGRGPCRASGSCRTPSWRPSSAPSRAARTPWRAASPASWRSGRPSRPPLGLTLVGYPAVEDRQTLSLHDFVTSS